MKEQHLIEALKNADSDVLRSIYVSNRASFINFANRFDMDREEVLDIYQDAIIALRENAIHGKLDTLNSSIKTYLFSIGKYMIYTRLKEQKKMRPMEEKGQLENIYIPPYLEEETMLTEEKKRMLTAFQALGAQCKKILTLFYYRGFTLDEITRDLDYSSKDVVKSQKSRCLRSLKEQIAKAK